MDVTEEPRTIEWVEPCCRHSRCVADIVEQSGTGEESGLMAENSFEADRSLCHALSV